MKIKLITQLCIVLSIMAMANPAPFGLEIEKTTIQEMKEKYHVQREGINKYSQGEMYSILDIDFDGIKKTTAIFDKNQKLVAVLSTFHKNKFNYLMKLLQNQYQLVEQQIPFVGNKYAKFLEDNTEIILNAPHLSFSMDMNYISRSLENHYEKHVEQEKEAKEEKEQNALFGQKEEKRKTEKKELKKEIRKSNNLLDTLIKKCNNGDADVCIILGNGYLEGDIVEQDYNNAMDVYTKAITQGSTKAFWGMGQIYDKGYGVEKSRKKAIEMYQKACNAKDRRGCYNLGILYLGKEDKKAKKFFNKACKLNYSDGCTYYKILDIYQ